ncbi:hypothetical protein ACN9MB_13260 [Dyella kyungheensis]|uniref:hypothetical protein n=1 Tax=Dyella kyungheensis TaxID=1242174 RepID=UPI003CF09EDC
MSTETQKVDVLDEADTEDFMRMRVSRAIAKSREWHRRLIETLRGNELADFHPDAARWQRNAYMARARRIRNEFAALARIGGAA